LIVLDEFKGSNIMNDIKKCSQCKSGGIDYDADYMVKGFIWSDNGKKIPYCANICKEHYRLLMEEGAELKIISYYGDELTNRKNELTRTYTGYNNFQELCRNNATLREVNSDTVELRSYYMLETMNILSK
jgi:hypothetical protein